MVTDEPEANDAEGETSVAKATLNDGYMTTLANLVDEAESLELAGNYRAAAELVAAAALRLVSKNSSGLMNKFRCRPAAELEQVPAQRLQQELLRHS